MHKIQALLLFLVILAGCAAPNSAAQMVSAPTAAAPPEVFLATFDGEPATPQPWSDPNWDVTIHSRGRVGQSQLDPIKAHHGPDCAGPPATHTVDSYADAVFSCRNHIMTALNGADYGVIYLTPNVLADFSKGETVIRFDMSTLRTSERDWVDVWITPYADNLQAPLEDWLPDLQGEPRNAVHVRMILTGPSNNLTAFAAALVRDFDYQKLPSLGEWRGYENVLKPDAARRDTFELRLTRTSLKFGLPNYNYWWVDTTFADLGWDQGVVQFGHHSYNPTKCRNCSPNTWHWDNISIAPARPFTIINANVESARGTAPVRIEFPNSAPPDAHLRFIGLGRRIEVSFDEGASWQPAALQAQERSHSDHVNSYWTPTPTGTQSVLIRGSSSWYARDFSIWAP